MNNNNIETTAEEIKKDTPVGEDAKKEEPTAGVKPEVKKDVPKPEVKETPAYEKLLLVRAEEERKTHKTSRAVLWGLLGLSAISVGIQAYGELRK